MTGPSGPGSAPARHGSGALGQRADPSCLRGAAAHPVAPRTVETGSWHSQVGGGFPPLSLSFPSFKVEVRNEPSHTEQLWELQEWL